MATAQGVPIVDPKSIIQHGLEIAQMSYLTGGRELEADKKRRIDELHQDQLDALDATLAMMTGQTPWIGDLEVIPGAEAEVLYAVEDNNPCADRLFGDAKTSIEEMIVATAQKYAGHPGLARAGLNPVEFRIWFQSLVKQESGFSIGARSPVGAFGLTQVMPDTAKDLGIYPAYYDDPMLQLDGGARYFLTQLNTFGSVPLDLTSIAKIGEVLTEAKLQVKEMIASNLKLDEQILKQIEQIATLKAQLDALRNGLTLEALGIPDLDTFFDDILPDVADLTGGLIAAKDGSYSLMTTSGKVGDKPAAQYVSEFFASAGLDVATVDTLANSEDEGAARIGTQANTAAFLSAAAETSSVKASESLERVHELVQEIPDTEGLKEAIDLNTRVTAELSIALANIWNMESAQLMGMGEAGVMDAATAAEEQKFIKVLGGE